MRQGKGDMLALVAVAWLAHVLGTGGQVPDYFDCSPGSTNGAGITGTDTKPCIATGSFFLSNHRAGAVTEAVLRSVGGINELRSMNNEYRMTLQTDGNVVIYKVADGSVKWAAGGSPGSGPYTLRLQTDGYFPPDLFCCSCRSH